jgi:hypothetical protein
VWVHPFKTRDETVQKQRSIRVWVTKQRKGTWQPMKNPVTSPRKSLLPPAVSFSVVRSRFVRRRWVVATALKIQHKLRSKRRIAAKLQAAI